MKNYATFAAITIAFLLGAFVSSLFNIRLSSGLSTGITNPELDFEKSGSCFLVADKWHSNGYCYADEIDGEKGVVVIHPLTRNTGRFLSQVFVVPSNAKILKIKVANVAGKTPWDTRPCPDCDSGVRIEITDLTDWSEHLLDDFIIAAKDGWVIKTYDITEFAGKPVILNIYSYAGGTDSWNGEWTAIGSVTIE